MLLFVALFVLFTVLALALICAGLAALWFFVFLPLGHVFLGLEKWFAARREVARRLAMNPRLPTVSWRGR